MSLQAAREVEEASEVLPCMPVVVTGLASTGVLQQDGVNRKDNTKEIENKEVSEFVVN